MKNFKENAKVIKIGQTIEYNIMDWMNYYNHTKISGMNIKGFNDADYLVLGISFIDKNLQYQFSNLTVGIHKDELMKVNSYQYFLFRLFDNMPMDLKGYIEKYGLLVF